MWHREGEEGRVAPAWKASSPPLCPAVKKLQTVKDASPAFWIASLPVLSRSCDLLTAAAALLRLAGRPSWQLPPVQKSGPSPDSTAG